MSHPGNDGSLGPLLDRDTFRSGHCSASDRCGMSGNGTGQLIGKISVVLVEGQERYHRSAEVINVLGLGFLTSVGIGFLPPGISFCGSLGSEFGLNPLDGRCWRPNTPGEDLPALLLGHDPMIPGNFHPACEGGVTRRKENPAFRCG
jgi:hypothetical protein